MCYEYKAWAIGKHRQAAKTEIEKLKFEDIPLHQLVRGTAFSDCIAKFAKIFSCLKVFLKFNNETVIASEAVRIILMVRDEAKDKNMQVEMGWVGAVTGGKHQSVPKDVSCFFFFFFFSKHLTFLYADK